MYYNDKFSFDNFRKWMGNHKTDYQIDSLKPQNGLVGTCVESKISQSKLESKISTEEEIEIEELAYDFAENGGVITEADDSTFVIEVDSGVFSIHKCYVTQA